MASSSPKGWSFKKISNKKSWKKPSAAGDRFTAKTQSFCGRQSGRTTLQRRSGKRKKESRRSRLQGPESLLRNFGADVDPNDEGWISTNHFSTAGGVEVLWTHQAASTYCNSFHLRTSVGLREAFQKSQLGKCLESWTFLRIRSLQIGQPQVWTNFAVPRNEGRISWPINTTSTILSYSSHVLEPILKFIVWIPTFAFHTSKYGFLVSKSCLPAFFLRSGIRHPWIYVCKVGSVTRGSTSFNPTFVVALSEAIS